MLSVLECEQRFFRRLARSHLSGVEKSEHRPLPLELHMRPIAAPLFETQRGDTWVRTGPFDGKRAYRTEPVGVGLPVDLEDDAAGELLQVRERRSEAQIRHL